MKRTSKLLISTMLLVAMLTNMLPMAAFAATNVEGGFYYQRVSTMQTDKEYLIVNSDTAGTALALSPASGASNDNVTATSSVKVVISDDGKIEGSDATEALEWKFMQASRSAKKNSGDQTSEFYMLQNKNTGAYLWNPAYEVDWKNDSEENYFGTSLTPLQDAYNGGTFASFDYADTVTPTVGVDYIAGFNTNAAGSFNEAAYYGSSGLILENGGDAGVSISFNRGYTINASEFPVMQYTFYLARNNKTIPSGYHATFFTNTTTHPLSADYTLTQYSYPFNEWYSFSRLMSGDTGVSNGGWDGIVNSIRIDSLDGNENGTTTHIDSMTLSKNASASQVIQLYRADITSRSADTFGGQYPSVEYPFNLFYLIPDNGGFQIAFLPDASGYFYLTSPESDGSSYLRTHNASDVYLYEKVYTGTATWKQVNNFEDGGEYVIVNVSGNTGVALTENNETTPTQTTVTVSGDCITSEVTDSMIYTAYSNAVSSTYGKTFWLSSNSSKGFLTSSVTNGTLCSYGVASPINGAYTSNANTTLRYCWMYFAGNLFASYTDKSCAIDDGFLPVGGDSFAPGGTGLTIFKKTYHTHTPDTASIKIVSATCTDEGYTEGTCTECGETYRYNTIAALGHDFIYSQIEGENTAHRVTCSRCDYDQTAAHSYALWLSDGDSTHSRTCADCGYIQTSSHVMEEKRVEAAVCGEYGYTLYYCSVFGCGYNYQILDENPTTEHVWDGGLIVKDPTCLTTGTAKYTCTKCYETDEREVAALPHVFSENGLCLFGCGTSDPSYVQDSSNYINKYVDVPTAGHEYLIANKNTAGNVYLSASLSDSTSGGVLSVPSFVVSDSYGKYITGEYEGSLAVWNAVANGNKLVFQNKENGEYLWADHATANDEYDDEEWVNKNIGTSKEITDNSLFSVSAATAAGANKGEVIKTGVGTKVTSSDGYYLGFRSAISTNGISIPGQKALRLYEASDADAGSHIYQPLGGYVDENGNSRWINDSDFGDGITGDVTIDFDFAMESMESCVNLTRISSGGSFYGSRIMIVEDNLIIADENANGKHELISNYIAVQKISEKLGHELSRGADEWHHIKIVSSTAENSVEIYIDGVLIISVQEWTFQANIVTDANRDSSKIIALVGWVSFSYDRTLGTANPTQEQIDEFNSLGFRNICYGDYAYNQTSNGTWYDNIVIISEGQTWYDDFDGNGNIYYSGANGEICTISEAQTLNADANVAKNVFVASTDNSNKLYFYEKQYKYTVNYYYDGVQDTSKTEIGYKTLGEAVTAKDKSDPGYTLSTASPAKSITITEDENTINVYYVRGYSAVDDTFALNFASTTFTRDNLTNNDSALSGVTATPTKVAASFTGEVGTLYSASLITTTTAVSDGVTVSINGSNIVATTTSKTNFKAEFIVEYTFTLNGQTVYSYAKLTVIPSTSIYFEDNSGFVTYTDGAYADGSTLGWTSVGTEGTVPAALYSDVYGYSDTYNTASYIQYSGASSKALYITSDTVDSGATAEFTFSGTGFDILSHCNNRTGIVLVDVYNVASNTREKALAVNTYLGYDYINGEWVKNSSNGEEAYQIPIIRVTGLTYGNYRVVVTPVYQRSLKADTYEETTEFYLDGVKIYDSLATSDYAKSVYQNDTEDYTQIYDIGDLIVKSVESKWYRDTIMGIMYIANNNNVASAEDYEKFGPNHEVYLATGNSVNFYISYDDVKPAKILVSASVMNGAGTGVLTVNGTTISTVASGLDMYYDITSAVTWNDSGNYSDIISISNKGDGILSLSTIKTAYAEETDVSLSFLSYSAPEMITFVSQLDDSNTVYRTAALGDINGDTRISGKDLLYLKKLISNKIVSTPAQDAASDMNKDGRTNSYDLIRLKKVIK